jgi:hypothetical protein
MNLKELYPNPHGEMCPWYDATEKFGAPNIKWCEETLCQWVSEPANTWSNLVFIVLAIIMWRQAKNHPNKAYQWFPIAMFVMGGFSFIYHMSNFYLTQILDFIGMYVFVFWIAIYNMVRLGWIKSSKMAITLLTLTVFWTVVLHIMYLTNIKFQMIVAIASVFIGITEAILYKQNKRPQSYKFFGLGVLFIVLAQSASLADLNRLEFICDPHNHFFQGHALWHVLSAFGTYFAFIYYQQFTFKEQA